MFIEIYQDAKGEWRWRMKAGNGRIIADGAEGYKGSITGAERAAKRIQEGAFAAPIRIIKPKKRRASKTPTYHPQA